MKNVMKKTLCLISILSAVFLSAYTYRTVTKEDLARQD